MENASWRARLWLARASGGGSKVQEAITNDLREVRAGLEGEMDFFKTKLRQDKERGRRLLFLFQRDLLPGINGKILESKNKRESFNQKSVDASSKLLGWIFIVLLNVGMLFYVYLFAMQQTAIRQEAWFKSFLIWLVTEVFFVSTAVVYFTHFVVPSIIMKDVGKIKQRLLDSIRDYNDHVKAVEAGRSAADQQEEGKEGADGAAFNAASYLFVSYRLAQQFPDLKESKIILRFSTPWPPHSYHHVRDVSKSYSKKFSALTRSASMILIFLIGNLIQVPPSLQDMIIHVASTATVGYTVLLHVQLFNIFPLLAVLPLLVIAVIVHFVVRASTADARSKLAKLAPADKLPESGKKLFPGDVGYVRPTFDKHMEADTSVLAVAVCNGDHKSRRASVAQGKRLLRQMISHSGSEGSLHEAKHRSSSSESDESDLYVLSDRETLSRSCYCEAIGSSSRGRSAWRPPSARTLKSATVRAAAVTRARVTATSRYALRSVQPTPPALEVE